MLIDIPLLHGQRRVEPPDLRERRRDSSQRQQRERKHDSRRQPDNRPRVKRDERESRTVLQHAHQQFVQPGSASQPQHQSHAHDHGNLPARR